MVKDIIAIIGANYGDEGKGLMTDYFAHEAISKGEKCIVALTNGGPQRGHTVVTPEGRTHVFHHFGSGTLAGADTYFTNKFILNPMIFVDEYKQLQDVIEDKNIKIFASRSCKVTTPFDMLYNMALEDLRDNKRHGSVGVGIWQTVRRYQDGYKWCAAPTFFQMATEGKLRQYLENVKKYYEYNNTILGCAISNMSYEMKEIWNDPNLIEHYIQDFQFMYNKVKYNDGGIMFIGYDRVIFENGQGLLLDDSLDDPDHNYYTTPSNTGLKDISDFIFDFCNNYADYNIDLLSSVRKAPKKAVYVSRSYLTKHGAGAFLSDSVGYEDIDLKIDQSTDTNVPNKYQGTMKYARLDVDNLLERVDRDISRNYIKFKKALAITHNDEYGMTISRFSLYHEHINDCYGSTGRTRDDVRYACIK